MTKGMRRTAAMAGAALGALALATPANALTIKLTDVGGVTNSPAQLGFAVAAHYWESVLTNTATVNINVGFSSLGPGILGGTSSALVTYVPISAYYGALAATGTSALDQTAAANFAPLSKAGSVAVTVPAYFDPTAQDGIAASGTRIAPDGTAISDSIALTTATYKALTGAKSTTADAEIQFSSDFAFDFNPTDGIASKQYDFVGVAIHEIGHALGFVSTADDFDYSVGPGAVDKYWWGYGLDMFRYSAPGQLDWAFGDASYFSIDGGKTALDGGYFSTGTNYGDGWQASHWKTPVDQGCTGLLGIMNPYICSAAVDKVTALDLAAFDAIGWNLNVDVLANPDYSFSTADAYRLYIASVPEPATWAELLLGFGIVAGTLRRRRSVAVRFAA